jgi:hypothetical protein
MGQKQKHDESPQQNSDPYKEGREAYKQGGPFLENPYYPDFSLYDAWAQGWRDGKTEGGALPSIKP